MNPSLERLKEALSEDDNLRMEFAHIDETPDAQAAWARSRGYSVTAAEMEEMTREDELSEEDLDRVAGGWTGEEPPPDGGGG